MMSRLGFPDVIIIPHHKEHILVVEAFCLLLHRLSYLIFWCDFRDSFGCYASVICDAFHVAVH
jgi:hypothetical protein